MIRWTQLDTATVPDDGGELRLMQRGEEYSIMSGSIELMNSRVSGSEEALAVLVSARLGHAPAPSVLIGGYGMGFTLRAALASLGPKARITVAELTPAVVAWARGPMARLTAGCLDDPRVRVVEGDVARLIGAAEVAYDAILLDVDNGPEGLSRAANDRIYDRAGLDAARRALRPGGILAVWSSSPSAPFSRRLGQAGFRVEEHRVRARRNGGGARHMIWLAAAG
ncbi:MAG: spermidine synthase [Caulobacteraceae bacterium]